MKETDGNTNEKRQPNNYRGCFATADISRHGSPHLLRLILDSMQAADVWRRWGSQDRLSTPQTISFFLFSFFSRSFISYNQRASGRDKRRGTQHLCLHVYYTDVNGARVPHTRILQASPRAVTPMTENYEYFMYT